MLYTYYVLRARETESQAPSVSEELTIQVVCFKDEAVVSFRTQSD